MKRKEDSIIVQGLPVPETPKPSRVSAALGKTEVVGKPLPRVDAYERVSGSAVYPSDYPLPDMLYGAILRCPHAHARVMSVDITRGRENARRSGRDLMEDAGGVLRLALSSAGSKTKLFDPLCRHEGEEVAAVAAETPYQAWDAVRAIKVEYEVLPFVVDERRPSIRVRPRFMREATVGRGSDLRAGQCGEGVCRGGCGPGRDLQDRERAPYADGTSWLRCQVGRRPSHPLGVDPGGLCGSGEGCRGPWPSPCQCAGHRPLHGRGLRKQAPGRKVHDHCSAACQEDCPAGETLPHPGRDLPLLSATGLRAT